MLGGLLEWYKWLQVNCWISSRYLHTASDSVGVISTGAVPNQRVCILVMTTVGCHTGHGSALEFHLSLLIQFKLGSRRAHRSVALLPVPFNSHHIYSQCLTKNSPFPATAGLALCIRALGRCEYII